jgi:hypothetical protein
MPGKGFNVAVAQFMMKETTRMTAKRYLFWGSAMVLFGAALMRMRPTGLLGAKVTAVTPGDPAAAHIMLSYGTGAPPLSVILDLSGRDGGAGRATIDGEQIFLDIPISGELGSDYRITTTATYRIAGMFWTSTREFEGSGAAIVKGA